MFSYEKTLPHLSLLGIGAAVTFDVGYFWGVDINFFTLFSLSEHTLFALQALPHALVIVAGAGFVSFVALAYSEWRSPQQQGKSSTVSGRSSKPSLRSYSLRAAPYIWFLGWIAFNYYDSSIRSVIWHGAMLALLILIDVGPRKYFYPLAIGGIAIVSLISAFLFGHYLGSSYVNGSSTPEEIVLKNGVKKGIRIVRSGERGVLYFDPIAKEIRIDQWADIQSLIRKK